MWRERGWAVFEAIEKHAKTQAGYASLRSVYRVPASLKDEMPRYAVLTCDRACTRKTNMLDVAL